MKLGDLIERITYYTGIKWLINKLFGDGCGCKERQEQFNDIELWDQTKEHGWKQEQESTPR